MKTLLYSILFLPLMISAGDKESQQESRREKIQRLTKEAEKLKKKLQKPQSEFEKAETLMALLKTEKERFES